MKLNDNHNAVPVKTKVTQCQGTAGKALTMVELGNQRRQSKYLLSACWHFLVKRMLKKETNAVNKWESENEQHKSTTLERGKRGTLVKCANPTPGSALVQTPSEFPE